MKLVAVYNYYYYYYYSFQSITTLNSLCWAYCLHEAHLFLLLSAWESCTYAEIFHRLLKVS